MRDTIGLLVVGFIYTISMIGSGVLLSIAYFRRVLPAIQSQAYVEGVMDCQAFAKAQQERDCLQGVETFKRIGVSHG